MNVCDYIVNTLLLNDIDTYFIVTGGSIVPFINAISKNPKTKYICCQHEQGASMAAEGYYRGCGKIAGVCVTSGPGVQNILNGVCGCWYDSIPAFFITGQVSTNDDLSNFKSKPRQAGFQEMPVCKMFEGVTKYSAHVSNQSEIYTTLKKVITELKTPRFGPVLLDLPVNVQMSQIENIEPVHMEPIVTPDIVYDISQDLQDIERPVIIFGHGVKLSGATKQALDFVKKTGIPFVVSWGAYDICETTHPLRIGSPGVYGDRCANYAVQNADLIISIGSRLDSRQIGGNGSTFSPKSRKVMIDIDKHEIGKMHEKGVNIDTHFVANASDFFARVNLGECKDFTKWNKIINKWKIVYGMEKERKNDPVVYEYLETFFENLPENVIVIPDIGSNLAWTMQSAKLTKTQKLFTNLGNASMGISIPCAIGACIGTGKDVYVIVGDGGLQMNIQELQTIKTYNLPIHIIVLDNGGYGMIKQFQDNYFQSRYCATSRGDIYNGFIDFAKIAQAYKIPNFKHVIIPETQRIYPKLMFGDSLENMTPYIDFEHDMIVPVPRRKKLGWN